MVVISFISDADAETTEWREPKAHLIARLDPAFHKVIDRNHAY